MSDSQDGMEFKIELIEYIINFVKIALTNNVGSCKNYKLTIDYDQSIYWPFQISYKHIEHSKNKLNGVKERWCITG